MSTAITLPVWFDRPAPDVAWSGDAPAPEQDVVVVGAGIAGLTAALELARAGRRVLVLEREGIGAGETLRTTAHLASALDDRFHVLARHHGEAGARLAAQSHAAAIDWIEALTAAADDDCGFRRVPGYLFPSGDDAAGIEREYDAARAAGLEVVLLERLEPVAVRGPVLRFARQARVDIARYLQVLAGRAQAAGCRFHRAEVAGVEGGARPRVALAGAGLQAAAVVVATNVPFHGTTATFHKQAPYRSFVVAGEIDAAALPDALYWDDADPYHYVRLLERPGGAGHLLLVGGADHKTGQGDDPTVYVRLQAWARAHFPAVGTFTHAWSGQVLEPADGLAFLGADPSNENVYLATGDSGNGITHGTLGGILIADLIRGRENPWADLYDPGRTPLRSAGEWARENANVAMQFRDWALPGEVAHTRDIAMGTGAVMRRGIHRVAVYRSADGGLSAHNARCPHMGCVVRWSAEEKSWDCPCHGSRFDARSGAVLNGPADAPLAAFALDDGDDDNADH